MGAMSTIDPTLARKARQARVPSTTLVIVVLALHVVGGLGNGYGWSTFATFTDEGTTEPDALGIVGITVGMPLAIIASIVWTSIVIKRSDVGLGYGFSAFWFGGGLGILYAASRFPQVEVLLRNIGFAALAIAVAFLLLGLRAAVARRAAAALAAEIMRTGTRTTATVTDKGYLVFGESTRILTTVTFTFTDMQGVQRWVQRPMLVTAADPIVEGRESDLWYDPTAPGDDRRIVVKLALDSPMRR
jgi:hypothetical protein